MEERVEDIIEQYDSVVKEQQQIWNKSKAKQKQNLK